MRLRHDTEVPGTLPRRTEFGRVAVLFGGTSTEREISLLSGNACLQALLKRGVDAHPFDPRDKPLNELVTRNFDRVFIALHGPGGEDGTLQGALEFLGMPYTGSGVMGSAIGMDKLRTKRLAQAVGIPTTDYMVLRSPADLDTCLERLGLPLIVKPATQGSSVGMTKVEKAEQLLGAFQAAALLEPNVFAEPWIIGARIHRGGAAGTRAAVHPHRDAGDLLRLPGQVLPQRHEVLLPVGTVARGREASRESRSGHLRRRGRRRLGPRRLHDGQDRPALPAGDQHRAGHDRPQPGAHGGARARHQFRAAGVAGARDQLRAARGSSHDLRRPRTGTRR